MQHFGGVGPSYADEMEKAAEDMSRALDRDGCGARGGGPPLDPVHDVNRTGMIGGLFTSTTSTTGNLAAKRTTTNPDVAGLIVHLFREAGVRGGDYVAVGGSGSFPALLIATLCAAEAMDLRVGLIVSLAASQWGANLDGFTWLDIEAHLAKARMFPSEYGTIAASVGGSDDAGSDLSNVGRAALRERILTAGIRLIEEKDLAANVATRMALYAERAAGRRIAAFVNIGGGWANLGTSAEVLAMKPGVASVGDLPPEDRRGVVHAMAAAGTPIVHLLDIAQLAAAYRLPWDPVPLPSPGTWRPATSASRSWQIAGISAGYGSVVLSWLALVWLRLRRAARTGTPSGSVGFYR